METTATQVETTIIPIESKTTLTYNFFISKHEGKGRNTGLQIVDALADLGFTYWISQHQDNADEDSIQQGIRDSEAIILVLTPGIFAPERRFVTNTEIKFAIDLKKPIILVDAGFKWEKLSPCMHLTECCENVAPEFQPYARALISALQVHRWHVDVRYRNVDMEIIIERYNTRDKEAIKLSNYVAREVVKGECMHSIHYFDDTKKPIGWTDRQHVMCEGFLSILAAVFPVISVVTYCQRYTEQVKQVAFINGTTKMSCSHTFMDGNFCNSLPGKPAGGTILAEAGTTKETCATLCSIHGNSLGDTSACCKYHGGGGGADGRCLYFPWGSVKRAHPYTYTLLGDGFCQGYKYLPDGVPYPEVLQPGDPLYNADRRQECVNRCADAYPDSTHFYLKEEKCACAKPSDCSNGINGNYASSDNKKYQRYTINRGQFHQASICLSSSVSTAGGGAFDCVPGCQLGHNDLGRFTSGYNYASCEANCLAVEGCVSFDTGMGECYLSSTRAGIADGGQLTTGGPYQYCVGL